MTTLILPPKDVSRGPRKCNTYCSLLTDIVRATADAEDALETFSLLLLGKCHLGFAKFDAHVGETGCHLRASMLREVFFFCKKDMASSNSAELLPAWIIKTKGHFGALRKGAEQACLQLSKHGIDPREIGFGRKRDTPEHIISILMSGALSGMLNSPVSGETSH